MIVSRKRNLVIITFFAVLALTVTILDWKNHPNRDWSRFLQSRRALQQQQLEQSFDNMQNQFTPGYKCRILGDDGTLRIDQTQAKIFRTQTSSNLAVSGEGFFCLKDENGELFYTRDGRFEFKDGVFCHLSGATVQAYPLDRRANICGEATDLRFSFDRTTRLYDGDFCDYRFDGTGRFYGISRFTDPTTGQILEVSQPLFRLELAAFDHPESLAPFADTMFRETPESGAPFLGMPGPCGSGLGEVCAGQLQFSNVDYVVEGLRIREIKDSMQSLDSWLGNF